MHAGSYVDIHENKSIYYYTPIHSTCTHAPLDDARVAGTEPDGRPSLSPIPHVHPIVILLIVTVVIRGGRAAVDLCVCMYACMC